LECVLRQQLRPAGDEALRVCREAGRLDKERAIPLLLLAQGLIGRKSHDPDTVRDLLRKAAGRLGSTPSPDELAMLALAYVDAGWLTRAEQTAARHPPGAVRERLLLRAALVRRRNGLPAGSARYRIGPDEEPVYLARFARIQALVRAGRWTHAGLEREEMQWAYPGIPGVPLLLCDELVRRGRHDEAFAACQRALRADPELALAHYYAGQHATTMGRGLQGLKHLRRAVELDPEFEDAWPVLAQVLDKRRLAAELAQLRRRYAAVFGRPARF